MQELTVNPKEYGIEEKKATELTSGLSIPLKERELLIQEFNEVSKLEITQGNLSKFKELRLKIVKNRTQGINAWHKTAKEWFLAGGKFVDATKRKEIAVNEQMEDKLMDAEKHFENLEKERLNKLQLERAEKLNKYVEDASERDLSSMDEDVWNAYLATKKKAYEDEQEAIKKAEAERIAKEKAERAEQERIRKENAKLKAEAEAAAKIARDKEIERQKEEQARITKEEKERKDREAIAAKEKAEHEAQIKKEREAREKIEREEKAKREKLENELKAKKEAEAKAIAEAEAAKQAELNKGDADKVKDLIKDLENLKSKYSFKSAKNQKMYSDTGNLIDKVIAHINK